MKWPNVFMASFMSTMICGYAVSETVGGGTAFFPLLLILILGLAGQANLYGIKFMMHDRWLQPDLHSRKGFFLRGVMIDPQIPEKQESEFLSHVQSMKSMIFIRAGYVVLTGIFLWIYSRKGGFALNLSTFLHYLSILLILPMATPAHFFAPLSLNALAVMASVFRLPFGPLTALYIVLLFTTLALHHYQNIYWSHGNAAEPTAARGFRHALKSSLLFFLILLIVNWLIPNMDPINDPVYKALQKLNKRTPKIDAGNAGLTKKSGETKTEGDGQTGEGGEGIGAGKNPQNMQLGKLPNPDANQGAKGEISSGGEFGGPGNRDRTANPDSLARQSEAQRLKDKIADLQRKADAERSPSGKADAVQEIKEAVHEAGEQDANTKMTDGQLEEKLEQLRKQYEQSPPTSDREKLAKDINQASKEKNNRISERKAKSPEGAGGLDSKAGETGGGSGEGSGEMRAGATPPGAAPKQAGKAPPSPQKPPPPPPEDVLKKYYTLLKALGVVLAIFLAVLFVVKLLRKKDVDDDEEESNKKTLEETKRSVRGDLKKLNAVKLTARQEVLKKYHLFLRFMAAVEHAREEHVPPTLYANEVSSTFPALGSDIERINSIFCETLYGDREVSETALKTYNSSINAVFANFR
ncbi:MAG: hypothetical protein ABL958_01690 [Bdellovibrionia bacterium]